MDAGSARVRAEGPGRRVLVVASRTPPERAAQARAFASFLADDGLAVRLELLPPAQAADWECWIAGAAQVDRVLVVAGPASRDTAPDDAPAALLSRVVPVVLPGGRREDLPAWAGLAFTPAVAVAGFDDDGGAALLRLLTPPTDGPMTAGGAVPEPLATYLRNATPTAATIDAERWLRIAHGRRHRAAPRLAGSPSGGRTAPQRMAQQMARRKKPPAAAHEARHLHAAVTDAAGGERRHAFAPGQRHTIRLDVRAGTAGIVAGRPLPEESVVVDQAFGAALDVEVVVDGPDGTIAMRRPLRLPPTGASSAVTVPVEVAADAREVTATVLVFQRATLLQSAQLRGPVGAEDVAPRGRGLRLELDAEVTADLAPPTVEVDASLCCNVGHAGDVLLVDAAGRHRVLVLDALDRFRDDVVETLRVALDRDDVEGAQPGSEQQVELLRGLARQGHTLYQALEPQLAGATVGPRVQLVSAEDEVVPLELVYDFGLPTATARLCRHWRAALATGRCRCRPRTGAVRTVCPLGFWGLRHVIERQLAGAAVALDGDPSPGRMRPGHETLPPLDSVLFAASTRVDEVNPGERRRTVELLTRCLGERAVEVQSWRAWHRAVLEHRPGVLLSLPHTDEIGGLVALEIGRRSIREVAAMTEDYVVAPGSGVGPVVLLLGCSTAAADIPWQSAVAAFRRRGASVVIGTLVETLGRQTAPLARHVAEQMWGPGRARHETIGDMVQALRREAVTSGATLGMSLVAFGEAGWRIPAAA